MKIVYIAHPISGDIEGNLAKIREIVKGINTHFADIVPFVPYYSDVVSMDDSIPDQRARGIANDSEMFRRMVMDELWVYGDHISNGVRAEIELAISLGIPVSYKSIKIRNVNDAERWV